MEKERMFPILGDACIKAIPWAAIAPHEAQARMNHSQTLDRLASRGGLSPCEAVAVMVGEPWRRRGDAWARAKLMCLVLGFEKAQAQKTAA